MVIEANHGGFLRNLNGYDKIVLLAEYEFNLSEEYIVSAVKNPDVTFHRGSQKLFLKIYDEKHAIQIVCEES